MLYRGKCRGGRGILLLEQTFHVSQRTDVKGRRIRLWFRCYVCAVVRKAAFLLRPALATDVSFLFPPLSDAAAPSHGAIQEYTVSIFLYGLLLISVGFESTR